MEIVKELSEISWQVPEKVYREDPALSYSTLSTYESVGYNGLEHLFDKKESTSLTEGSMVDCLITSSVKEFEEQFYVADFPSVGDKEKLVADYLFINYGGQYSTMEDIPATYILEAANSYEFQKNWKDETRIKVLTERCSVYYTLKVQAGTRIVVPLETMERIQAMVRALRESPATCGYFADDDEMSPIRRYYQLKFKFSHDGVNYRSMADLIVVDYDKKIVYPIDLKTSSMPEWDFEKSFCKWHYYIQSRLYWRNIRANMDADDYFKDFILDDYRFIVVNKKTLTPLVWKFPLTKVEGTLLDEYDNEIRDPFEIGKELQGYLDCKPPVPNGINKDGINIINCLKVKEDA